MRIVAGKYRSRILKSLKGNALRPTSDRLRETLFNVLGPNVTGSRFLDVFAGLGAAPFLSSGSLVIAEHRRTFELPQRIGRLLQTRVLRQGDAALSFFQHQAAEPDAIPEAA